MNRRSLLACIALSPLMPVAALAKTKPVADVAAASYAFNTGGLHPSVPLMLSELVESHKRAIAKQMAIAVEREFYRHSCPGGLLSR